MHSKPASRLVEAFIEDHQQMTRGLAKLLEALRGGDLETAVELADRVNRQGGPHIEFEENVLYPQVGKVQGDAFEQKLRSEHEVVRRGLLRLQAVDPKHADAAQLCPELEETFQTALEHAESCGTLISHLETLPERRQDEALERLEAFRRGGRRWTELHQD